MDGCWWRACVGLFFSSAVEDIAKRARKWSAHCTDRRRLPIHGQPSKCESQYGCSFETLTLLKEHGFIGRPVDIESLEVVLAIVLPLLLILAGDVELNPGPTQKGGGLISQY